MQIENFYNTQNLHEVVKDLQFKENVYGEEADHISFDTIIMKEVVPDPIMPTHTPEGQYGSYRKYYN